MFHASQSVPCHTCIMQETPSKQKSTHTVSSTLPFLYLYKLMLALHHEIYTFETCFLFFYCFLWCTGFYSNPSVISWPWMYKQLINKVSEKNLKKIIFKLCPSFRLIHHCSTLFDLDFIQARMSQHICTALQTIGSPTAQQGTRCYPRGSLW